MSSWSKKDVGILCLQSMMRKRHISHQRRKIKLSSPPVK